MKLCFVSDSYPFTRPYGGIAVYTQTAAQALALRGHEVHVLVPQRPGLSGYFDKDFSDGDVQVHYRRVSWLPVVSRLMPALGESFGVAKALRRLQRRFQFDLIEFPNFEGLGLVTQLVRTAPVVVRLHTSMVESVEVQRREPTRGERFMMWAERTSARLACGVVTHSTPHRDRLAGIYKLGDVAVIPHGVFIPEPRDVSRVEPNVLSLGRLNARKGGPTLLAAAARVLAEVPGARLTVVGANEAHPLARQFCSEHPGDIAARVKFYEFVDGDELEALWEWAQIYTSASVYESFGLSFAEAMARGVPVVGCATSAMNEIIEHERTGLLVPPLDEAALAGAIVRLMRDRDLRERMAVAGRKTAVEKYSAARMGADIERWYQGVLERIR